MDRLMLIDGNSLLRRAFHTPGYEHLTHEGRPTGAIFGFFRMLRDLLNSERPNYLAVAFDHSRICWRNTFYSNYKANRKPTPPLFKPQKDYAKECLRAFKIATLELKGYEADDLIATAADIVGGMGMDSVQIVTADRDLLQMVSDRNTVLLTNHGVSDLITVTPETMLDFYGCHAYQVADLKALMGDSSDNIPGLPGVGKKTAIGLINKYHSLEGVLQAGDIKGSLATKIQDHGWKLPIYKKIATLDRNVSPFSPRTCLLNLAELDLEAGNKQLAGYGIVKVKIA